MIKYFVYSYLVSSNNNFVHSQNHKDAAFKK